jgi:hemerythrin-like domain-containing protein
MSIDQKRRDLLRDSAVLGLTIAAGGIVSIAQTTQTKPGGKEPEVTATEDLMREHGVIRRALLVYSEAVPKLRKNSAGLDASAIRKTAQLFRDFGENYHEKMLEEDHIFPRIRRMNKPPLTRYVEILTAQHQRGREITDYILAVANASRISSGNAEPLARVFEGFVRMYANHAAREDTIIFPAWKTNFTDKQLDEISDQFEDIEHKMFGKDGFDDAEQKIAGIEQALGLSDLSQFTPPLPPKPQP